MADIEEEASSSLPPFSISMPPPNITGSLHMGHALVSTLQDVVARWKRMCGYHVLWTPGLDHAGIATQTVVERMLLEKEGKRRTDYSREDFVAHIWKWKEAHAEKILNQLKQLGCSCTWDRLRFTLDPEHQRAVSYAFKQFFDQGLIYRGDYLVNWDPVTQTALADDEVEYEERASFLWFFRYFLEEGGHVTIATTRPETLFGDTALAVSPEDTRYAAYIGKNAIHPLTNRTLPIIGDKRIDPTFGTGVVKITPAHDPHDYEMGLDHHLPFCNILTPQSTLNEQAGPFAGLSLEEAREKVVHVMEQKGLLVKKEPHTHRIGVSYRSKAPIEPYLSKQWFLKMEPFKPSMRTAVEKGHIRLIPESFIHTYFHWIDHLRDWCLSRQLWWGHRIPVWYAKKDPHLLVVGDGHGEPPEVAADPSAWQQEEDVLDTWFSSALWPFAILGWPEKTPYLKNFYPNDLLITGHDILFFWVARMIALGERLMKEVPFREVLLHGLIFGKSYWRTTKTGIVYLSAEERRAFDLGKVAPKEVSFRWEKMSKSKGNIIDPVEIMDTYGTDAMRIALILSSPTLREIDLDRRKFEESQHFVNKIWNGARFIFMQPPPDSTHLHLELEDHWILQQLYNTTHKVEKALTAYTMDHALQEIYHFFWDDFCAIYIEIYKKKTSPTKHRIGRIVISHVLRLLHPIAPFITEELFEKWKETPLQGDDPWTQEAMKAAEASCCARAPFPKPIPGFFDVSHTFLFLLEIVTALRRIRGEMQVPLHEEVEVYIKGDIDPVLLPLITSLVRIKTLSKDVPPSPGSSTQVGDIILTVLLPQKLLSRERERLRKEQKQLQQLTEKIQAQVENPEFIQKAPQTLVAKQKALLASQRRALLDIEIKLQEKTEDDS